MSTTQPIRNREELSRFMAYYDTEKPNLRNCAMINLDLYTALRISDVLKLKWEDVYDFKRGCFLEHLVICEQKTGKQNMIALNVHLKNILERYRQSKTPNPGDFLFSKTTDASRHLSRSQAYRIVQNAANATLTEQHIGCHSLRKTFGYFAWQQGISPALLMDIYNHSSFCITKRYLGIRQDERDTIYRGIDYEK